MWLCCIAACASLAACGKKSASTVEETASLARGLPGEPHSLDPFAADDNFSLQVLRDLWEGLTNIDGEGNVSPGVATDWTVDAAGTTYEFHLRHDAKWSDGENVVAQQFVSGLRYAVDPSTGSGSAGLLSAIKNATAISSGKMPPDALGITAVDKYSVRLVLERPAPFVLQILAEPICAPRRDSSQVFSTSRITEGPFEVEDRRPGAYIKLKANPFYWNKASVGLRSVTYVITESDSTELRQYLANQIDLTYTVPLSDLARLQAEHGAELQSAPILGTMYLALNLSNQEIGNKPALRQALSMAIDREEISAKLTLGATPAFGYVASGILNYSPFRYDWANLPRQQQLVLAKQLYEKSGHSDNNRLKITLYYNNNESIKRIMVAIAESWSSHLGIETNLVGEEFRVFLDGRKDRTKWDAARLGWWADYNDASSFLEIFTTSGSQNDPGYSDSEYDSLITAARAEPDRTKRSEILSTAEGKLLTGYPIIPVYFYSAKHLVKQDIHGASISAMNRTYSRLLSRK